MTPVDGQTDGNVKIELESVGFAIDEILPPHLCSVCFITFMDSCKANLVLGNFAKKLGFGQTPLAPWLVRKTNFSHFFRAPLMMIIGPTITMIMWET